MAPFCTFPQFYILRSMDPSKCLGRHLVHYRRLRRVHCAAADAAKYRRSLVQRFFRRYPAAD